MIETRISSHFFLCTALAIGLLLCLGSSFAKSGDPVAPVQISLALESSSEVGSELSLGLAGYPSALHYDPFVYSIDERETGYKALRLGSTTCVVGECPTAFDGSGGFDWRVAARAPEMQTPSSRFGVEITTSIGPNAPVPLSPLNNVVYNQTDEVVLSWEGTLNTDSYSLYLYNRTIGHIAFKQSVVPISHCQGLQCVLTLPANATANLGNYSWRVASRNAFGARSNFVSAAFAVHPLTPNKPVPIGPVQSLRLDEGEDLSITWEQVVDVEAYDLLIWSRGADNIVYRDSNIESEFFCEFGVCTHLVENAFLPFRTGEYIWRVAARNGQARSSFSHTQFSLLPNSTPNIVYLMADDLGYADLNVTDMPRSFALAQEYGIELPFFTYQNCAPTRTALMTGNRSSRLDITGVDPPPSYSGIPVEQVMISERLQAAGYQTGVFGKWHLGLDLNQSPLFNGFDEFVGFTHGWINSYGTAPDGMPYPDGTLGHDHHSSHDFQRFGAPSYEAGYSTFVFRDAAVDFINRSSANSAPYYVYVPFNAPHGPYSAPREYVLPLQERFDVTAAQMNLLYEYAGGVLGKPLGLKLPDGSDYSLSLHRKLDLMLYYAAVRALDDAVADILEALIVNGDIDNTFFMFASDNGASPSQGGYGSNAPYSEGKGSFKNGGHRVANFAVFPKHYGIESSPTASVWVGDLYETFAQIAELGPSSSAISGLDSTGLLPVWLDNQPLPPRRNGSGVSGTHFVMHEAKRYDSRRDDEITYEWAIIDGDFKYVRTGTISTEGVLLTTEEFLFDFIADVSESTNLMSDPTWSQLADNMRDIYNAEGGDSMVLGWHTTDKAAVWDDFVPEEWGFPTN